MANSEWRYSTWRDLTVLMFVFAGSFGAVVAIMLIPLAPRLASAASGAGQETVFLLIYVLPLCLMVLWAIAWWTAAAIRARRMRRLIRNGVSVLATVEQMRTHRHRGSRTAVTLWLRYEFEGETYHIKKGTSWFAVVAPARDAGRVELAVDPQSPKYVAFVVDGWLG